MKATNFEYRHQTLVHLLIVSVAFCTYLVDRDDIVWVLVRGQPHPQILERFLFAIATLLMGAAAVICTRARAYSETSNPGHAWSLHHPQQLGNFLFFIGLGFLMPLPGFIVLVLGGAIVFLRLILRRRELLDTNQPLASPEPSSGRESGWGKAFRQESAKWGLFLTMIVFTVLLIDRVAEVLAVTSVVVWVLLNVGPARASASR